MTLPLCDVENNQRCRTAMDISDANNVDVLLNTGNGTFISQVTYSSGASSESRSVATADVNGDSKADVIVANFNGHKDRVFLNTGNATLAAQVAYSASSSSGPIFLTPDDVDVDGKLDIIVANSNGNEVGVLLGDCPCYANWILSVQ